MEHEILTPDLFFDLIDPRLTAIDICSRHNLAFEQLEAVVASPAFNHAASYLQAIERTRCAATDTLRRTAALRTLEEIAAQQPTCPTHAETIRLAAAQILRVTHADPQSQPPPDPHPTPQPTNQPDPTPDPDPHPHSGPDSGPDSDPATGPIPIPNPAAHTPPPPTYQLPAPTSSTPQSPESNPQPTPPPNPSPRPKPKRAARIDLPSHHHSHSRLVSIHPCHPSDQPPHSGALW